MEAVNRPGALPDLDQGWQAVVRLELKEVSYKLVREYEREMEEALEGNLPMEERNLLRIHRQTLKRKKSVLREKICRVNPLHSSHEEVQPLLDQMERDIVTWSEPSDEGEKKVNGGALYKFIENNFSTSKDYCERFFYDLVKQSDIHKIVETAVRKSECLDVDSDIQSITAEYHRKAVGPAASEVLESGLSGLRQFSDILKRIPGPPQNVKVIGRGSDRVKLSWDPPTRNPEAVEAYIIYKKPDGREWEVAARTEKTKVVVKKFESCTKYEISVLATNSAVESVVSSRAEAATNASVSDGAMFGISLTVQGVPQLLMAAGLITPMVPYKQRKFYAAVGLALLPLGIAMSPMWIPLAPVMAVCTAVAAAGSKTGDLTEE